jgi:hypothetical protein
VPRQAEFSEFAYTFGLTAELAGSIEGGLRTAPVFPSTIAEGKLGYDAFLDLPGIPLFLQFKRPVLMVGARARERVMGLYNTSFYRMPLHSAARSRQHHLLCELEDARTGAVVYYVAPTFHRQDDFNRYSAAGLLAERSFYAAPSLAGHFTDGGEHHFAYLPDGSEPQFCSQPRPLGGRRDRQRFRDELRQAMEGERAQGADA